MVARRRTDPRAEANANAVVVRILLEAGTLHRRCVGEAQRTVALWQSLAAGELGWHLSVTLYEIIVGFVVGSAGGLVLGFIIALSPLMERILCWRSSGEGGAFIK